MEIGILDTAVQTFESAFTSSIGSILGLVTPTFYLLMTIDLVMSVLLNLGETDHIKQLISKVFKYGFVLWVVTQWSMLANAVTDTFVLIGSTIGGGDPSLIKSPSSIIDKCLSMLKPLWTYFLENSLSLMTLNIGQFMILLVVGIAITLAFVVMAVQTAITYIEYYAICAFAVAFIPFGVNKHTSFLAEKAIGAVFSIGTKLMVLSAILGLSANVLNGMTLTVTGTPDLDSCLAIVSVSSLMAFLCWQAPAMAAGLMSGAPSLSAGTVAGGAAAGGALGAVAGTGIAKAVGAVAGSGLKGSSALAGAAVGGAQNSAATNDLSAAAGAMGGIASFAGAKAKQGFQSATQGMRDSYGSAKEGVTGSNSNSSADESIGKDAGSGTPGNSAGSGSASSKNNNFFTNAAGTIKNNIPPEGSPEGGMSVPIHSDD